MLWGSYDLGYFVVPTPKGSRLWFLRSANACPMPRRVRQWIRDWMYQRHWLADMEDVCAHCGKIAWLDCHTIPYPTCGRDECEDVILEESDEYRRERRLVHTPGSARRSAGLMPTDESD